MNNWTDLVISVAVAVIPVIATFVSERLLTSKEAVSLVQTLEPLAKAAVTAAEKLGVTKQLDGALKKSEAVKSVLSSLSKLGFTRADEAIVSEAVEKAFLDLKDKLHEGKGGDAK